MCSLFLLAVLPLGIDFCLNRKLLQAAESGPLLLKLWCESVYLWIDSIVITSVLEMQTLSPHPTPTEPKSMFKKDPLVIYVHIKA